MDYVADGHVVADTDLIIDFLRGRGPGALSVREWLRDGRLRLTAITAFELRVGTDFMARRVDVERLLAKRTLPLDTPAAVNAGEIFAHLRSEGIQIGIKDCLQGGICRRFDLALATRNVRHFERVRGLRLLTQT